MASQERSLPPRPRLRKSIAHMPSPETKAGMTDKENMTTDLGALSGATRVGRSQKSSRSKSVGPGGLDALLEGSNTGNRRQSVATAQLRSILKPTVPLSPLREIPTRKDLGLGNGQTTPRKTGNKSRASPGKKSDHVSTDVPFSGAEGLPNPFQSAESPKARGTKVSLRTEEEQQAAARVREEQERREEEKREILARRDARRKSLANRRVEFAPDATLHTWDVVEYFQDLTTSSASTNSTRRESNMSQSPQGKRRSPRSAISSAERPKTPPKQADETPSAPSPAHQRDLHQKKRRRRSSAIPPVNFDEPETEIFSSPHSGSSIAGSDDTEIRDDADVNSDSDDSDMTDSQGGNNTIEVLDEDEDDTSQSMASARSMGSNNSSGRLDEALRMAAQQAGTQAVAFDEKGDQTMEMEEDVTRSFKPWTRGDNSFKDIVSLQDQENKNPFSPAFGEASTSRNSPTVLSTVEEEMSMDMTTAVGGILPSQQNPPSTKAGNRRKSMASDRRRSVAARRQSSGADSSMEDETMDLTMAIGGIQEPQNTTESAQEDEEMTMEFTSVVGGVLVPGSIHQSSMAKTVESRLPSPSQQLWDESGIGEMDMDMTVAVGGILPAARRPSPVQEEEETMGMDMTTAIGGILPKQFSTGSRSQAKALMEAETDMANLASSPFQEEAIPRSPPKSVLPVHVTTSTTATGSPILSTQRHRPGGRKSLAARKSTTPRREMDSNTPVKNPATPSKQITPKAARPLTPGKTPPSKNVTMRTSSPKTLFKAELKNAGHTPKSATPRNIFTQDLKTGISTPSVILTPRRRRSSGLGLDREGLGSPRVAALLDRRRSIGEDALSFTAQQIDRPRAIHFEDPKDLEREIEQERFEEQAREDGRAILEREADVQDPVDREATVNLKELIETLSPKKKIAGRKSLHVGAAKGLLGKRPAELDDEDQENSPKRLKGRAGSPVKNIMLPPPPSKTETTGRLTRASRKSLAATTSNGSQVTPSSSGTPAKDSRVTTPRSQGRFKDVEVNGSAVKLPLSFDDQISEENMEELEEEDEKIHLQDFLNMTSIRFMELTTTKRRHTVAPNALEDNTRKTKADQSDSFADQSVSQLEACVVAGACTVPMLELYQHSCRELKKYISEGRSIVHEIEADTFEENPPLFREYISASPDVKFIMDNQFKNVKTHARLHSKAMWYEWRMKLLEGLREGLAKINDGMMMDDRVLRQQEDLLAPVIPLLVEQHDTLFNERAELQLHAKQLAECDQEELDDAREKLVSAESDLEAKRQLFEDMKQQLAEKESGIEAAEQRKQLCLEDIKESNRIREECRGWSNSEVAALHAKVLALEEAHGWTITTIDDKTLTMTYRQALQLCFHISSFLPTNSSSKAASNPQNSPISTTYMADSHPTRPVLLTTEKRFFLQYLRAHLQSLHQGSTTPKHLLSLISQTWNQALVVSEELRLLELVCPTQASIISDNSLAIQASLLLPTLESKVQLTLELSIGVAKEGISVALKPKAVAIYGERFNEATMDRFLASRIGKGLDETASGTWAAVVVELESRLIARGRVQGRV